MNEILSQSIFFGIAITLVTYEIGLWIKQKTGKAIANPLLISVILIVAVLLLFHIDYESHPQCHDPCHGDAEAHSFSCTIQCSSCQCTHLPGTHTVDHA